MEDIIEDDFDTESSSDSLIFESTEQLALYTTMCLKRAVSKKAPWKVEEAYIHYKENFLDSLVSVINHNVNNGKIERKGFLSTVRDYARIYRIEWSILLGSDDLGHMLFNTLLLIVGLRVGLEKLWVKDDNLPYLEDLLVKGFLATKPTLQLTSLSQADPLFGVLAPLSPQITHISMPLSNNSNFLTATSFRSLVNLEISGGVSDKVFCKALWGIDQKSDKVLNMIFENTRKNKDIKIREIGVEEEDLQPLPPWVKLSLPHLEVLTNNILNAPRTFGCGTANLMSASVGSAALVLQPKMKAVENRLNWDTFRCIQTLLDMEAKYTDAPYSEYKVNVEHLTINYEQLVKENQIDNLIRAVKVCPKLTHLTISNSRGIYEHHALLVAILPVNKITKLNLDACNLTDEELTIMLSEMENLKELTLHITLQVIFRFTCSERFNIISSIAEISRNELTFTSRKKFPSIRTLRLDFASDENEKPLMHEKNNTAEPIIRFLELFSTVEEIYFNNTLVLIPPFLVFGCIGGSLAVLLHLQHLSVLSCGAEIPRELNRGQHPCQDQTALSYHYKGVPNMLPGLREEITFKHLRSLKSFELDEFYISEDVDSMIEELRLCGVQVSVFYRPSVCKYPRKDLSLSFFNRQRQVEKN
ncbi:unnamed protein product [Meganyctiphanes norvegica]|uniref:Uncharacterized protein n=1 Tax=Meganyctiphanes norvegica TaxID=48144 RepID=A0AAV2QPM6_MEGNR